MNSNNETPKGIPKPPPLPTGAHTSRPPPVPRPDSTGKQVIAPPPRRDNTGKQLLAPASMKAPPPASQKVSFLPPAPARSGTTDPGGLQTRVDTPHSKQKTPLPRVSPPAGKVSLATPDARGSGSHPSKRARPDEPGSALPSLPPDLLEEGPSEAAEEHIRNPPPLPAAERKKHTPLPVAAMPSVRSVPSHSGFKAAASSFLFPESSKRMAVTWGLITLAVLSPVAFGVAHSCQEEKPGQKIEQAAPKKETRADSGRVETRAAPKPTSSYIPKALRNPPALPAKPMRGIPRARNCLRA